MEKVLSADRSRVLVTGPESTGKSALVEALADHFGGLAVPEYAREYIGGLPGPYGYSDVEHIAGHQVAAYENVADHPGWVFFDTWLIVTKVWFQVVYDRVPPWIDRRIRDARFGLVLLCDTSIPWLPDPIRENGGPMREKLFDMYQHELSKYQMNWKVVTGKGREREQMAIGLVRQLEIHG